MIITICSSIDFSPKIIEIKKELDRIGHQVNIPYFTQKIIDGEITIEEFLVAKEKDGDILFRKSGPIDVIKRHWNHIKKSDAILVLNLSKKGIENYIGGNTLMEIGFAYVEEKKIFLYNSIPERSERMHYVDEVEAMKPVIIDGDLLKIN